MRIVILLTSLLIGTSLTGLPTIEKVRKLYKEAAKNERACKQLIVLLDSYTEIRSPLLFGYKASANMMMAKHVFNPFSKLKYFNKGKGMMNRAIKAEKKNVELRFLRFAAQTNVPSFLGYNKYISKDKAFLLQHVATLSDNDLKNTIVAYLQKSAYLNEQEKAQLK